MAWPNPFRRHGPNTRTCWGYTFELTDSHPTVESTEHFKHSYDVLAEECLEILDSIEPPQRSELPRNNTRSGNPDGTIPGPVQADSEQQTASSSPPPSPSPQPRDLYQLLKNHHHSHPKLQQLWDQVTTIPDWVDWAQLARGQDVFYRYGGANLTGLAYQSLLGGMGGARVVETLARTGGFSTKAARRRLFETTQHILQCTRSLEALQPGGEGFASSIRVRFLHAAVRRRILKLAQDRPEYYKVREWGIPINDLDSMATIVTFSATLIWLSLPRQGIWLRQHEITDFIALWRYIAYLVGAPTDQFATPERAKQMMEFLLMYEINPTETSKLLANNIIKSLDDQPPSYASADMLVAGARWLNGNELADRLGLARPGPYYWLLFAGQCIFFMFLCYGYRHFPAADRRKNDFVKRVFYDVIVHSSYGLKGKETLFELTWIPELNTVTELTIHEAGRPKLRGLESRNLRVLLIAAAGVGSVSWVVYKVGSGIVGLAWRALS